MPDESSQRRDTEFEPTERDVRVELAACYRIVDLMGWTELIYNHITAKVPGPDEHFLINPFGLMYSEVTASNLVKVDLAGNVVGDSTWPVNAAGFVIHSAIHAARPDVTCILHTHTTTGIAVACLEAGLTQTNFYSALLHDKVAYHDFEGVTTRPEECPRMVASLGDKNHMILRNHGLLACGRTVPEAFSNLWTLQRACDVQVSAAAAAKASGGGLIPVTEEAARFSTSNRGDYDLEFPEARGINEQPELILSDRVFEALRRRIDAADRSYRD